MKMKSTRNSTTRLSRPMVAVLGLVMAVGIGLAAMPARADLQGEMDSMFNAMVNITNPQVVMDQRRGLIAGGRYSLRTQIMDIQIITAVPPSINAGCAGIDLFGGSFSFISADRFIQSLRQIAANAAGYAFKVAMETMCPTCAAVMSKLRTLMNKLNAMSTNSCAMAKQLVSTAADFTPQGIKDAVDNAATPIATKIGAAVGYLDAKFDSVAGNGDTSNKVAATAAGRQKLIDQDVTINVVWEALQDSGADAWWGGGDTDFLETIMSVTGTLIIEPPPVGDPNGEIKITPLPHLIEVEDFMKGTGGTVTVQKYECGTGSYCLNPTKVDVSLTSFSEKIRSVVNAIVGKYSTNTPFTTSELAFMDSAPAAIGGILRNLARMSPGMALIYANQAAPTIAQIMAADLVLGMIRTARIAMSKSNSPFANAVREDMAGVADAMRQQTQTMQGELDSLSQLVSTYNALMQAAQKRRLGLGQITQRIGNVN